MRITIRDVMIEDEAILDKDGNPLQKEGVQLMLDDQPIGPAWPSRCDFDEVRRWFSEVIDVSEEALALHGVLDRALYGKADKELEL